jgi:hypothetical protein
VDVAFWNIFLTCSLLPSQHRTEIFYDQARILHRLRTGGPINIGRVIFNAIREACGTDDLSMVFPCLITAFCSRAGIDVTAGLEHNDPSMLTRTRWNQQLALRGLPPVGDYAGRRRRREERAAAAAAMAQEQPEEDPAAAARARSTGDQFHTLLQAMKAHMDLRIRQMEVRMEERFDDVETSIDDLRTMMTSRFSVASGSGAPSQPPIPDQDPYAASGSGFEQQFDDQRTPIMQFDDEEQQDDQLDSDQHTEILPSDEDGGD